jgi:8-oxo-dGTP pyrophosphatase MutT (NUDIX family)
VSGLHADALQRLRSWIAPSAEQELLRKEYVAHLESHADGLDRSCQPDHITASTLVLSQDGSEVLLTLHGKAGRWFQLGGHVEPTDPTLASAALREATEECGLTDLLLDPDPVHLDSHEVPFCGGPGTRHLDVRFLAVIDRRRSQHATTDESVDVRWWAVDDLPSRERSLRELVDLGRDRLRGSRSLLG